MNLIKKLFNVFILNLLIEKIITKGTKREREVKTLPIIVIIDPSIVIMLRSMLITFQLKSKIKRITAKFGMLLNKILCFLMNSDIAKPKESQTKMVIKILNIDSPSRWKAVIDSS